MDRLDILWYYLKCDLTEDEQISELCKDVYFLQVEPEWCFGEGKCPGLCRCCVPSTF